MSSALRRSIRRGPCATARRRSAESSACRRALIRTSPSAVRAGCTMGKPGQGCSQSSVPSAGATLVAPAPLSSRTCGTPSIVISCGEL